MFPHIFQQYSTVRLGEAEHQPFVLLPMHPSMNIFSFVNLGRTRTSWPAWWARWARSGWTAGTKGRHGKCHVTLCAHLSKAWTTRTSRNPPGKWTLSPRPYFILFQILNSIFMVANSAEMLPAVISILVRCYPRSLVRIRLCGTSFQNFSTSHSQHVFFFKIHKIQIQ